MVTMQVILVAMMSKVRKNVSCCRVHGDQYQNDYRPIYIGDNAGNVTVMFIAVMNSNTADFYLVKLNRLIA
jgi:hypothetical protein